MNSLFNKVLKKEKYTLHTITHLILFMCVFCHTRVQNLLIGPVSCAKKVPIAIKDSSSPEIFMIVTFFKF